MVQYFNGLRGAGGRFLAWRVNTSPAEGFPPITLCNDCAVRCRNIPEKFPGWIERTRRVGRGPVMTAELIRSLFDRGELGKVDERRFT
jgi:hypothetical protein